MGLFDNIERRLEGVVNGGFARAFAGDVQPVEIASRLQRELDAQARLLRGDRRLVPNRFQVRLSGHDFDQLVPYSQSINDEVISRLRSYASDQGYVFNGPIEIDFGVDESLPTGRFTVGSQAVAAVRPALVLETATGARHPLVAPGFTIGRGSEADVRITDPGISRLHARITVSGPADDPVVEIEDAGSTNGVVIDGVRVPSGRLRAGSRVELGTTRLLVRTAPDV